MLTGPPMYQQGNTKHMRKNEKRTTKQLVLRVAPIIFAIVGLFFLSPQIVHAGVFSWLGDAVSSAARELIETVVFGLLDVFISLLALLVKFVSGILEYVMGANFNRGIIRQPFVLAGWQVVRDFANMFFVVILVIVSIGTMLRQEQFNIRRVLPMFILIALLVNFSLVLVGFVVDLSQIVMVYFLNAFADKSFGTVLANAALFDEIFTSNPLLTSEMGAWEELGVNFFLKVATIFAMLFMIFVVAVLAVLFIIRTVILWVVAILAPLAFVAYILPASRQGWNTWLKTLTNWALFGPVAVFFLWLAGMLMEKMQQPCSAGGMSCFGEGAAGLETAAGASTFLGHGTPFIQAAAIFVFLFLAINAAKMFTGSVGATVAGRVERYGRKGIGMITGPPRRAAGKAAERVTRRPRQKVRERMERIPVLGPIIGGPGKARAEAQAGIDKGAGKYRDRTNAEVREGMKQLGVDPRERASMLKVLAERRKLTNEDRMYFKAAAREGANVNEVLDVRPDWAGDIKGRSTAEEMAKMRPGDMSKVHPEAYKDPEVQRELAKLSPEHIAAVARTISRDELGGFQAALDSQADEIEKTNPVLHKYLSSQFAKRLGLRRPMQGRESEAALEEYGKWLDEQEELLAEESVKDLYKRLQKDVADALREQAGEPPEGIDAKTLLPIAVRANEQLTNEWLESYNKAVRDRRMNYTRGDEKGKWIEETLEQMGYEISAREDERTDSRIVTVESAPGPGRIRRRPPGGEPEEGPGGPAGGGTPPPPPPGGGTPPPAPSPRPPRRPPGGGGGTAGGAQPPRGGNIPPVAGAAPTAAEEKQQPNPNELRTPVNEEESKRMTNEELRDRYNRLADYARRAEQGEFGPGVKKEVLSDRRNRKRGGIESVFDELKRRGVIEYDPNTGEPRFKG